MEKFKTVKEALQDKNRAGGYLWCDYTGAQPVYYWSDELLEFQVQYKVLRMELTPTQVLEELADWGYTAQSLVLVDDADMYNPCVMSFDYASRAAKELAAEWECTVAEIVERFHINLESNPANWQRAIEVVASQGGVYGIDL